MLALLGAAELALVVGEVTATWRSIASATYPIVLTAKDDDGASTQYRTSVRLP